MTPTHPRTMAIVGATGNVGRTLVTLLVTRGVITPDQLTLFGSPQSDGRSLSLAHHTWRVQSTEKAQFEHHPVVVCATESDVSLHWVPRALAAGSRVLDTSSAYRLNPDVPLVVPPLGMEAIAPHVRLVAHANCLASPIALALAPLRALGLQRAVITTFQSVSGAGKQAMHALEAENQWAVQHASPFQPWDAGSPHSTTPPCHGPFPRPIACNVIPQVGSFLPSGSSQEEWKIAEELKKILGCEALFAVTSVRVPVYVGHSMSLFIHCQSPCTPDVAQALWVQQDGLHCLADYVTPLEHVGQDTVAVCRVRSDPADPHSLLCWLVSDNLRRGAALDAWEIASHLWHTTTH